MGLYAMIGGLFTTGDRLPEDSVVLERKLRAKVAYSEGISELTVGPLGSIPY